jgi:5-methylcytosine-specific restriction endonuclease McrA
MAKLSGNWIRKAMRLAIYLRDRMTCVYCGVSLLDTNPFDITLDHVVPRNKKGKHLPSNLVTACRSCNSSKQDKDAAEWCTKWQLKRIAKQTAKPLPMKAAEKIIFGKD